MTDYASNPRERATKLLQHLRSLKEDRGAMADLRCALSLAKRPRAWPHLASVGGIDNIRVLTVAGLFALHPEEAQTGNLGTTCQALSKETPSFDIRFRRLLSCDRDEICDRLRPIVLAAKAEGISVNYERLFIDLWYWSNNVKANWAREYWGAPTDEEALTVAEVTG